LLIQKGRKRILPPLTITAVRILEIFEFSEEFFAFLQRLRLLFVRRFRLLQRGDLSPQALQFIAEALIRIAITLHA